MESEVNFCGNRIDADEIMTPSMENQVVVDWLEGIGGVRLVKFIGQEYARELEKISIFDLQETLGNQATMGTVLEKLESEEKVRLNRTVIGATEDTAPRWNRKN
jgi:hypothetical protein